MQRVAQLNRQKIILLQGVCIQFIEESHLQIMSRIYKPRVLDGLLSRYNFLPIYTYTV